MILESSIVPVPSELVLVTAGLAGMNPSVVGLAGGAGSTIGAAAGYLIGREGRIAVDKYGKYFLATSSRISRAEGWFRRWGNWAILASRLAPFIPYKVFSITAGLLKMNYRVFLTLTLVGSIPRCYLLAWLGRAVVQAEYWILAAFGAAIIAAATAYHTLISRRRRIRVESHFPEAESLTNDPTGSVGVSETSRP
ncbi:DedA family protein [Candidatus Bathyarchaeota archaeon]|nr:DedA family protein [Candidatus Bathyarchaeota archaeon]